MDVDTEEHAKAGEHTVMSVSVDVNAKRAQTGDGIHSQRNGSGNQKALGANVPVGNVQDIASPEKRRKLDNLSAGSVG